LDNNNLPNRNKRLAFILSGITDALIGAAIILIGFGVLPIDVTDYGFENWHAMALGGVMLFIGVVTLAYNLSRLNE
jgi:ABC-type branched-subunit amino acid transport system permease subunit